MSKAKVHESIAWVESFPTNIAVAAFGDGKKLRDLDDEVIKRSTTRATFSCAPTTASPGASSTTTTHLTCLDKRLRLYQRRAHNGQGGARCAHLPAAQTRTAYESGRGHRETGAHGGGASHHHRQQGTGGDGKGRGAERLPLRHRPRPEHTRHLACAGVIKNVAVGVMRNLDLEIGYATSV